MIFGSRAKGNYKPGSDIDLAVMDENIDESIIRKLKSGFEESTLPYKVDIVHYASLQNTGLKEHIDRVGVLFYP